MGQREILEMVAFICYLCLVLGIGIYFFIKGRKQTGDKAYFLGGREMNGWVAALSAGASDIHLPLGYGPGLDFHRTFIRNGAGLDFCCTETSQNVHSCGRCNHHSAVFDKEI